MLNLKNQYLREPALSGASATNTGPAAWRAYLCFPTTTAAGFWNAVPSRRSRQSYTSRRTSVVRLPPRFAISIIVSTIIIIIIRPTSDFDIIIIFFFRFIFYFFFFLRQFLLFKIFIRSRFRPIMRSFNRSDETRITTDEWQISTCQST